MSRGKNRQGLTSVASTLVSVPTSVASAEGYATGDCRFCTCQELVRFLPLSPVLYSCQLCCRSRSKGMSMLNFWARVTVHKSLKTWTRPHRPCASRYAHPGFASLDYVVGITGSPTRDHVTRSARSAEIIRSGLCPTSYCGDRWGVLYRKTANWKSSARAEEADEAETSSVFGYIRINLQSSFIGCTSHGGPARCCLIRCSCIRMRTRNRRVTGPRFRSPMLRREPSTTSPAWPQKPYAPRPWASGFRKLGRRTFRNLPAT